MLWPLVNIIGVKYLVDTRVPVQSQVPFWTRRLRGIFRRKVGISALGSLVRVARTKRLFLHVVDVSLDDAIICWRSHDGILAHLTPRLVGRKLRKLGGKHLLALCVQILLELHKVFSCYSASAGTSRQDSGLIVHIAVEHATCPTCALAPAQIQHPLALNLGGVFRQVAAASSGSYGISCL